MEKNFYRVPESRMAEIAERIGKLNRRAKKLGVPQIVVNNVGSETVKIISQEDGGYQTGYTFEASETYVPKSFETIIGTRTYQHLTVTGETPKLAGWAFLGTLQHLKDEETGENFTVLRSVPGETIPASYRQRPQWCDHCRVDRYRRDTYIVRNDAGETKQVGSSCIRDFLGGVSPEAILASMEILLSAEDLLSGGEGGWGMGSDDMAIWRDNYLTTVAAIIRTRGWKSRKYVRDFGGESTADAALAYFSTSEKIRSQQPKLDITDADTTLAEEAIEWGRGLTGINRDGSTNDYEWNLRASLVGETLKARTEGLVASLIPAYLRHQERELKLQRKAKDSKSEFIGTVGKREVFELTLVNEPMAHESDWGSYYISRFLNGQNEVVWFGSKLQRKNAEGYTVDVVAGETVKVKATVKRHEERNGVKQTIINRAVLVEEK